MTLAFFADMGVYYPDFTKAQEATYGRSQGCAFALDSPADRGEGYTCPAVPTANSCTADRRALGWCSWYTYE
jgi:hypothetical protein